MTRGRAIIAAGLLAASAGGVTAEPDGGVVVPAPPRGSGCFGTVCGSGPGPGFPVEGTGPRHSPIVTEPVVRVMRTRCTGRVRPAAVSAVVGRARNRVSYCYERQLLAHPELRGSLQAQLAIGDDGVVSSSSASGVSPG